MAEQVSRVAEQAKDDGLTVCAFSLVAEMICGVVHEGMPDRLAAQPARGLAALGGSGLAGELQ